ncbi:MAG: 3-phosphoshikimate 1-carboxyvinyltransferase [Oscillospiraceae bacterium]|nr:3-phosphoshikimate 1-carboxyvinyltransferase [Oscillospiraceae bacterium]
MYAYSRKGTVFGSVTVPGSKSHTIRAVMLGALAEGSSVIHNPLPSKDGLASVCAARTLGAKVTIDEAANIWTVEGLGGRPKAPAGVIDTLNSGTTTSFALGVGGLVEGYVVITGDEQICRRPWGAQARAMQELGAFCLHTRPGSECLPIVVGGPMKGGVCHLNGFSSQHISGILLPSPLLDEGCDVEIRVEKPLEQPYLQMTIDWMRRYGAKVEFSEDYRLFRVKGGQKYLAQESLIPSDWSGVAFPLVAAVCTESELVISGVDFDDSQGDKAVVDILIEMGADITRDRENGRLVIRGGKPLHGTTVDMDKIPDSLPALSVAAAYAQGDTLFTNLAHVRVKESDRVAVMQEVLGKCGADIDITADSMTVHGGRPLHGASVPSYGDHRIAMAMAVCGLMCEGEMEIADAECASVSFPHFYETMNKAGAGFTLKD